jgi:phosphoesterase RecJ-like protein
MDSHYKNAADYFRIHDNFLLLCHEKPDGDALGCVLGAAHVLQKLGKTFTLVNDDPIPQRFHFLPMADRFLVTDEVEEQFDVVISLDCGDRRRLGRAEKLVAENAKLLNIDHHITNDYFGTDNLVDLEAAATCQIVYKIAKELELDLDVDTATCLYTGLATDTGCFRYSNTTEEVLMIAASLLRAGVTPYEIIDQAMETMSWSQILLIRESLSTLERDESGKVAWVTIPLEVLERIQGCDDDTDGIVNYPRNIQGVEVGILFRDSKVPGKVKVSLRSKYHIDVGAIAVELGGGGHARAAGATVEGDMESVKTRVIKRVQETLAELGNVQ